MKRHVIPLVVLSIAAAGCGDSTAGVRTSEPDGAPLPVPVASAAALVLEDAASRVAPALADQTVAFALTASLDELAESLRRGDGPSALRAARRARVTLDGYAARRTAEDVNERDVIAIALGGAERLLDTVTASR